MRAIATIGRVIGNTIKFALLKLRGNGVFCKGKCTSRLDNEYRVNNKGKLSIGYHFASLRHCRFLVSSGELVIGDNVGMNTNCIIACHERIEIGNDVEFSGKHKGVCERSFSKSDLGKAAYTLSIKIYRDRSRCLIRFFNEYIP